MKLTTEQIQKAYLLTFGHNADNSGFEYWKKQDFQSENDIYKMLISSEKGQGLFAGKSNAEIVEMIYQNGLNRASDAEGKAYWVNLLDTGAMDLPTLIQTIGEAAIENGEQTQNLVNINTNLTKSSQIELAFLTTLGRPASATEILPLLKEDKLTIDYINDLATTDEFKATGKTVIEAIQDKISFIGEQPSTDIADMMHKLTLASEIPNMSSGLNAKALTNQMAVSLATTADLVLNPEKEVMYQNKIATQEGLDYIKETMETITTQYDLSNIANIIKIIENPEHPIDPVPEPNPEPQPEPQPDTNPEPQPDPDPQPELSDQVDYNDVNANGVYDKGDTLTIDLQQPVSTNITTLFNLLSGNSQKDKLGVNATLTPVDEQDGMAQKFMVTLGENANINNTDINNFVDLISNMSQQDIVNLDLIGDMSKQQLENFFNGLL